MPTPWLYTLSLPDALPILSLGALDFGLIVDGAVIITENSLRHLAEKQRELGRLPSREERLVTVRASTIEMVRPSLYGQAIILLDRKSTRLNSSHANISYADSLALHSFPTRRSSDLEPGRARFRPDRRRRRHHHRKQPAAPCRKAARTGAAAVARGEACHRSRLDHRDGAAQPLRAGHHPARSEEHTSELQSRQYLVCRLPGSTLFPYPTLFRS